MLLALTVDFKGFFLESLATLYEIEYPAILGNVLLDLQVIRPFSYMSQEKLESHES
jgi:hypothetical protein